jgi:cytoskeletal protein RodZ
MATARDPEHDRRDPAWGARPHGVVGSTAVTLGARLRRERELRGMSAEEIARATRIPLASIERLEADRFDDLPGEVFVRGFLRAYARAIGIDAEETLAQYGSARRVPYVAPVPVAPSSPKRESRRLGVAIAFVLLLVLCTMALSFVLKPRGRDLPSEVSTRTSPTSLVLS